MPPPKKLVKLLGSAAWCALSSEYGGRITRGILREGKELVIDFDSEGRFYAVKLQRRGVDQFDGTWSSRDGETGTASAKLYRHPGGNFLFGEWSEGDTRYHWWAELTVVAHFADEK